MDEQTAADTVTRHLSLVGKFTDRLKQARAEGYSGSVGQYYQTIEGLSFTRRQEIRHGAEEVQIALRHTVRIHRWF